MNELLFKRYELRYLKTADRIFVRDKIKKWNPKPSELESFCNEKDLQIKDLYSQLKKSESYYFTGNLLQASSDLKNKTLVQFISEGFVKDNFESLPYDFGEKFKNLKEIYTRTQNPINLTILIIGYSHKDIPNNSRKNFDFKYAA